MKIVVFFAFMFSFNLLANTSLKQVIWSDVEEGQSLQLNEVIVFQPGPKILENEWVTITEAGALALPGAALFYIEASRWNCQDNHATADLILMTPKNSPSSTQNEVGIDYNEDCNIGIYIEAKDINQPGIFKGDF